MSESIFQQNLGGGKTRQKLNKKISENSLKAI